MTSTSTLSPDSFSFVCNLVRERAAIVLEQSKTYLVEARLAPIARQNGFSSTNELVDALRSRAGGNLQSQVVEAMTTNETSFFRDVHPFEALKNCILPELIAKRAANKTLNIWSAACSSGQEVYSIAMIIKEHFPQLASWKVNLLATDVSNEMLERCRLGAYNQAEINRGLPAPLLVKYFRRNGLQWHVSDTLRTMVQFAPLNFVQAWPPLPMMDVVFLRNVLIYFSVDTKKQILARVRRNLATDGCMFLGGAETTMKVDDCFVRTPVGNSVCYRLGDAASAGR